MGVFDGWEDWQEGDFTAMEPMHIDLSSAEGFQALENYAGQMAYSLYGSPLQPGDAWETLAGRDLADVAEQLANDLMQESVSLPVGAFADPQAAGRELRVVKRVAVYVFRQTLEQVVANRIAAYGVMPSGRISHATQPQRATPAHRREAHK